MLPLYRTGAIPLRTPASRMRHRRGVIIVLVVFLCFMAYVMLLRSVTNSDNDNENNDNNGGIRPAQSPQTQLLDEVLSRQQRDPFFEDLGDRKPNVIENDGGGGKQKQGVNEQDFRHRPPPPPPPNDNNELKGDLDDNDPHKLDNDGNGDGGNDVANQIDDNNNNNDNNNGDDHLDGQQEEQQQKQQPKVKREQWHAAELEADGVRKQEKDRRAAPVRIGADFDNPNNKDKDRDGDGADDRVGDDDAGDAGDAKKLEDGFIDPADEYQNARNPTKPPTTPNSSPPQQQQQQQQQQPISTDGITKGQTRWAQRYLSPTEFQESEQRRLAIVDAFVHAWSGYEKCAWGFDELAPLTCKGKNWVPGGIGMTIIDALDTMILMDLNPQIKKARDWISSSLDFAKDSGISLFETTIRNLGGLLSAFALTKDTLYLEKAIDLADRLSWAFNTKTGIPYTTINLKTNRANNPSWSGHSSILAEVGTLQLEFRYLSHVSGNKEYDKIVTRIMDTIESHLPEDGLAPVYIDEKTGEFRTSSKVTLGALGDSYFEYLIKQWWLTGKTEERYKRMYEKAISSIIARMVGRSSPSGLTFIGELEHGNMRPKMDHLACFAAGMLALGAEGKHFDEHMKLAEDLTNTCREMYARQPTGIAPELVTFQPGRDMVVSDAQYYILRPETIEALFYMWRATKDKKYRDWGWEIFQAIQRHCKVDGGGYAGLRSVTSNRPTKDDTMQSFFLAETLKYLYLLFSPDEVLDLDKWVFNTEAHPLPVFSPSQS